MTKPAGYWLIVRLNESSGYPWGAPSICLKVSTATANRSCHCDFLICRTASNNLAAPILDGTPLHLGDRPTCIATHPLRCPLPIAPGPQPRPTSPLAQWPRRFSTSLTPSALHIPPEDHPHPVEQQDHGGKNISCPLEETG